MLFCLLISTIVINQKIYYSNYHSLSDSLIRIYCVKSSIIIGVDIYESEGKGGYSENNKDVQYLLGGL